MRLSLMAMCLVLLSCQPDREITAQEKTVATAKQEISSANAEQSRLKEAKAMITVTGTIVYKEIEGGFYALDATSGKKYQPQGLPLEYRKNGLVVKVSGIIETEMASIQQYGEILKVQSVKVIDSSKVSEPNTH